MRRIILPVLAALTFLVPAAEAHIGHPSDSVVLEIGGFTLAVAPTPAPVTIDASTRFVLVDVRQEPTRPLTNATLRYTTPHGDSVHELPFHANDTIWETDPLTFQETGTFAGRILLGPDNAAEGPFTFNVYRRLPFAFAPIDATRDPTAGVPFPLTFHTLNPSTGQPEAHLSDLRGVLRPTNPDRPSPDDAQNIAFTRNGTAGWTAQVTFPIGGTWRIELASDSGGFQTMDAPPWQIDVLSPASSKPTPTVGTLGTLFLLGMAVAVARRRTRRP